MLLLIALFAVLFALIAGIRYSGNAYKECDNGIVIDAQNGCEWSQGMVKQFNLKYKA
jgi:hypothetical protein